MKKENDQTIYLFFLNLLRFSFKKVLGLVLLVGLWKSIFHKGRSVFRFVTLPIETKN